MSLVNYVEPDGTKREVQVPTGTSVMEGALQNGVEGILGECGGAAMCATCHVFVDSGDIYRLPSVNDVEDAILDSTTEPRRLGSRLSCQIPMTDELDGITVFIAGSQV